MAWITKGHMIMHLYCVHRYETVAYLDYQIKSTQDELRTLQIEHLRIQNDIVHKLMEQDVYVNHSIITCNIAHLKYQAMVESQSP